MGGNFMGGQQNQFGMQQNSTAVRHAAESTASWYAAKPVWNAEKSTAAKPVWNAAKSIWDATTTARTEHARQSISDATTTAATTTTDGPGDGSTDATTAADAATAGYASASVIFW